MAEGQLAVMKVSFENLVVNRRWNKAGELRDVV
jgi:hypothetical protein